MLYMANPTSQMTWVRPYSSPDTKSTQKALESALLGEGVDCQLKTKDCVLLEPHMLLAYRSWNLRDLGKK